MFVFVFLLRISFIEIDLKKETKANDLHCMNAFEFFVFASIHQSALH